MRGDLYRNLTRKRYLIEGRIRYALKRMGSRHARTVLFFPMAPHPRATIIKVCNWTGCRITTNRLEPCDAAIYWDIAARRRSTEAIPPIHGKRVINGACTDVSKEHVDSLFAELFGYDIRIDPRSHSGLCLRKSNENGTHDGSLIRCPIPAIEPGFVYQKVIDNTVEAGLVEDLRVPICGELIPFVIRARREAADRFAVRSRTVRCYRTSDVLTAGEVRLMLAFCRTIGLDFGELDVLRDRHDGRIYIVDANPTPWGPPAEIAWSHQSFALRALAEAFEHSVLR